MTILVNSGATVDEVMDSFKRDKQLPWGKIRIHPFDSTKSQHFGIWTDLSNVVPGKGT
jgi:hypothetical protein